MPELPDILAYIHALEPRIRGQRLQRIHVLSPFLLRTFEPPLEAAENRDVADIRRIGKRMALTLPPVGAQPQKADRAEPLYLVLHLMIAGRLRWHARGGKPAGKIVLARLEFPTGTLVVTEAGAKKRAALHLVRGDTALHQLDPGGLEVLETDAAAFAAALRRENHTLKRALTDPRILSGIGNAYSDEILHAARLSPLTQTRFLSDAELARLHETTRRVLTHWIDVLRAEFADRFPGPGDITAFRPDFAVHGKFGQPCPACRSPVQRIRCADNETNYCPTCQTGGRILADRSLSRLLGADWPRTLAELEQPTGAAP